MKTITRYTNLEEVKVDVEYLRRNGVHACLSGCERNGYELLVASGKVEQAKKCLKERIQ